jgi:MFS family permease
MVSSSGAGRGLITWYHGWNIVAVCVLSQVAKSGLTVNAFSLFLHGWTVQLHTPVSTLQLGFAAYGLVAALLAPLTGILADKYPSRLLFGTGLLLMTLVCFGMSFITATWQFLVLYALPIPVVACLASLIPANAVVSRWFVRRLGFALGLTALGQGLPGVFLPPIVAAVLPSLGWRTIWRIGGIVIGLVILPIVVWVLRDRPTERDGSRYVTGGSAAPLHRAHSSTGITWRDFLTRRNFWVLVAVFLALLAGYLGTSANLAPIAASHGMSEKHAGALLSVFHLSQLTATLVSGMLSDRFGNRLPLAGLALASTIGSLLIAFGNGLPTITLAVTLIGLSAGFWPLLAAACAAEFGADGAGRAFGLVSGFIPLVILTPFMVAKTQEISGSYAPALSAVALLTFLGGMACLVIMRERHASYALQAEPQPKT